MYRLLRSWKHTVVSSHRGVKTDYQAFLFSITIFMLPNRIFNKDLGLRVTDTIQDQQLIQ